MYSVISGDIISSSGLQPKDREFIMNALQQLLDILKEDFKVFGRIVKGDYLECVVPKPSDGLRVALIIKTFIKAKAAEISLDQNEANRLRQFRIHGIRLALALGDLIHFEPEKDIIDGEAIYLSGREISSQTTFNKERITIKNAFFFVSSHKELNESFQPVFSLLDVILSKATSRQCEVVYYKLRGFSETEISRKLKIGQSAVNQHSTGVGWNAIEEAVNYFEKRIAGERWN